MTSCPDMITLNTMLTPLKNVPGKKDYSTYFQYLLIFLADFVLLDQLVTHSSMRNWLEEPSSAPIFLMHLSNNLSLLTLSIMIQTQRSWCLFFNVYKVTLKWSLSHSGSSLVFTDFERSYVNHPDPFTHEIASYWQETFTCGGSSPGSGTLGMESVDKNAFKAYSAVHGYQYIRKVNCLQTWQYKVEQQVKFIPLSASFIFFHVRLHLPILRVEDYPKAT